MLASTWWAILSSSAGLEHGVELFQCVQVGGGDRLHDNNAYLQLLGPAQLFPG